MSFVYIKIDNIKYNGYNLYYKKPIDETMTLASEFNDKYTYFYNDPNNNNNTLKPLGKFKCMSKKSSNSYWDDYDYEVYEFTEGYKYISISDKDNIYCQGIPENYEHMIEVKEMLYLVYPVYYEDI